MKYWWETTRLLPIHNPFQLSGWWLDPSANQILCIRCAIHPISSVHSSRSKRRWARLFTREKWSRMLLLLEEEEILFECWVKVVYWNCLLSGEEELYTLSFFQFGSRFTWANERSKSYIIQAFSHCLSNLQPSSPCSDAPHVQFRMIEKQIYIDGFGVVWWWREI